MKPEDQDEDDGLDKRSPDGFGKVAVKVIAYLLLGVVILFGLVFGFCALSF